MNAPPVRDSFVDKFGANSATPLILFREIHPIASIKYCLYFFLGMIRLPRVKRTGEVVLRLS